MQRYVLALTAASVLGSVLYACGGEDEAAPIDTTPIVGTLELPISANNGGSAPTGAARIEISSDELRVDSVKVIDLERGRPAASELRDHRISKLADRLRAPVRTAAALWVNANVPYATLVEVLNTLQAGGTRELHFAVRREAMNPTIGWMRLSRWEVVPWGEDAVHFRQGTPLQWSAFTPDIWRESYEACRAPGPERYIDCDGTARNIAPGGDLQVILWTRAQAMKVTFRQVDAPDAGVPAAPTGPALIEGVRPTKNGSEEEYDYGPPVSEASFNFRQMEAAAPNSAISATVRPMCGNNACQMVVEADATGASMRVISFLGAAYANGFQEPQIAFRIAEGMTE